MDTKFKDFGEVSEILDELKKVAKEKDLSIESEAQTRFDVIDRLIREILQWRHGQITVEEFQKSTGCFIDYKLCSNDYKIIIEAKKLGAAFPSYTNKKKLKLTGSIMSSHEISDAIAQAYDYGYTTEADVIVITNGDCWCFFPMYEEKNKEEIYVNILFPLKNINDAEMLFNYFCAKNVELNSLKDITSSKPLLNSKKLLDIVLDADARVDRNSISDYISPALDNALFNEALFNNVDSLKYCFVTTDARTKFDNMLNIHIRDSKPVEVLTAKRIRKDKKSVFDSLLNTRRIYNPPVTLIIGCVGSGKSTYLKHFELIGGKEIIGKSQCHWVYVDLEEMGVDGCPHDFIYRKLQNYLLESNPGQPTDFENLIEPAYRDEIEKLKKGPLALRYKQGLDFDKKIIELIEKEYELVEPYVEKLFKYISQNKPCVIVLDNIDLYENEELETKVFSEGIALSKRIHCNIVLSIRDTTFVKHRNDSIFNAYEIKTLWLDPPPFEAVLSKRLLFSQKILDNKSAKIPLGASMILDVPNLGVFFEIVQKSILNPKGSRIIEYLSDKNIRKGLTLVRNFLTSGHINADLALQNYIYGDSRYLFPKHEIFKGAFLGQWKHYKEDRSDAINLLDSYLGSVRIQTIRLYLVYYLNQCALSEQTCEVKIEEIISIFSKMGISSERLLSTLEFMRKNALIKSTKSDEIKGNSIIHITGSGGYYISRLIYEFYYIESVMYDTNIYDEEIWNELNRITIAIETQSNNIQKMRLRQTRGSLFLNYIKNIENDLLENDQIPKSLCIVDRMIDEFNREMDNIFEKLKIRNGK